MSFKTPFGIQIILDSQLADKALWIQFCNFSMLKRRNLLYKTGEDGQKYEKIYAHI